MICFRDMTFCASPNCRNACGRQFTTADKAAATRWWSGLKGEAPVAFSYFCGGEPDTLNSTEENDAGRAALKEGGPS